MNEMSSPLIEFSAQKNLNPPHLKELADYLQRYSPEQAEEMRRSLRRRLREQEVTFNLLGSPGGSKRQWSLDEVPHLLTQDIFFDLSSRLAARARLLSACLDDIYVGGQLVAEGVIPPQLVLGNPRYFRSLHGWKPVGSQRLHLYAADLVRAPNGDYLVHSDRTAAPTGAGYALENRLALGHLHAEPFREYRVRKLNQFFDATGQCLRTLGPQSERSPRVVLLTPGQQDESSFEHGYLARYLGIDLAEGRDLTVRGDEVFLKTLDGLKPVDVIWRRLSDQWCDPLELREDSLLGVAGLVQAARSGRVAIANSLGSGIVESPAFRAYLPEISRALLGEELALPSIKTRYLGDRRHLEEVFDTWSEWTLRPAFFDRRGELVRTALLTPQQSEQWRERLKHEQVLFVAEQSPLASRVPLGLDLMKEGSLSLRLFAHASGDDYHVMPGGLARANAAPDGLFLKGDEQAISKDVWVSGSKGSDVPAPPRMPSASVAVRRGGIDVPSRLFDDIFWLGRYAERCDGSCRLVRQGLEPLISETHNSQSDVTFALRRSLLSLLMVSPAVAKQQGLQGMLLAAVYESKQSNSIHSSLERIHSLTTATRSRLSSDTWKTLRRLTQGRQRETPDSLEETVNELEEVLLHLAAYRGLIGSNMVRGQAWLFMEIGRRIERGVFVLTLIIELFSEGGSRDSMETLLRVCDSLLTYRSRYLSTLYSTPVVDLVLTDETNPQSVLFQVKSLLWCVRQLPTEVPFPLSRAEQRLVRLEANIVTSDLKGACRGDAQGLRELAEEGINLLWQVSDDIAQSYFTHAEAPHALNRQPGLYSGSEDIE